MSELPPDYNPERQEQLTPSQEVARVLSELGEEYGFDPQTCSEVADLPFEEAFQDAYGYLVQAGLDADEALAQFTENPINNNQE